MKSEGQEPGVARTMNPTPDNDVCALSARELAQRIARREVSAVQALEAHLARIERRNPDLNAVLSLDLEAARRQAEAADVGLGPEPSWRTH